MRLGCTAWALGSTSKLIDFPVLGGIETLTILVDNDADGAGQNAAAECSERWLEAGREVYFGRSPITPATTSMMFSYGACDVSDHESPSGPIIRISNPSPEARISCRQVSCQWRPLTWDCLPSQLQPWIADACERLQCPGDYIAVSGMAAAGSVIGRKVVVRPHLEDDWAVVCNQWAMCIGRPGVMKSPATEEGLGFPIKQLSAIAEQQFTAAQARYEVDAAASENSS